MIYRSIHEEVTSDRVIVLLLRGHDVEYDVMLVTH